MGGVGIKIANVLLASLCCFQVAAVVNKISADALVPIVQDYSAPRADIPPAARGWEDRAPILERNLFGAQIVTAPVAREALPEPALEETKLPLKLLGTMLSADPARSTAAITERGALWPELVHERDRLAQHPTVTVARIERGRVVLQNGSRREELLLSEESLEPVERASARSSRRSGRQSRSTSRARRSSAPSPASLAEQLKGLQIDGQNLGGAQDLFSQARITPKWEGGQMTGMEVRDILPGSLYEKIGLKDGDVIESLNGVKLDSTAAGAKVLGQIGEAEEFEILLSDGTVKTLRSDEISALLEEAAGSGGLPTSDEP